MNYETIYNKLIESRLNQDIHGYYETHHILPRCLGGTDDVSNLIKLTAREHLFAHILLMKIYPDNVGLSYAVRCMSLKGIVNSRKYEFARIQSSKNQSEQFKALWQDPDYLQKQSFRSTDEYKNKVSLMMKDYYSTDEGKANIEIVRVKITGKVISEETRLKMSESLKGVSKPEGFGDKISAARTGMKFTEEHKENFRKARTGKGTGERNSMSSEENRRKLSEAKVGSKAVYSIDGSRRIKRKEELSQYHLRDGKYFDYE
jgi:hypothetical protein